mgnify:CR=1 FL=1
MKFVWWLRKRETQGAFDGEILIKILKSGSSEIQSNKKSEKGFRDGFCELKFLPDMDFKW